MSFLFFKLLFQAAHQGIHHHVPIGLHLQSTLQLFVFLLCPCKCLTLLLYFLLLTVKATLKLIHLLSTCAHDLLSFHLLEFLLLDIGFKRLKTGILLYNLEGLGLESLVALCHLIFEFLLETAHDGIHHHVSVLLNVKITLQPVYLLLKSRLGFSLFCNLLLCTVYSALKATHGLLRVSHHLFRLGLFELFLFNFFLELLDLIFSLLDNLVELLDL